MKVKLLEIAWKDYETKVLPPDCSDIQKFETKKAFYAGAGGLLDSLLKVLGPGADPTEADLSIMDGIQEELNDYLKEVMGT